MDDQELTKESKPIASARASSFPVDANDGGRRWIRGSLDFYGEIRLFLEPERAAAVHRSNRA
ncbi:MAG: hypothetical protein IJG77_01155 [Aeriscardovia sp.]|nr:hypothetical protein [Aeriscardovia sp.]